MDAMREMAMEPWYVCRLVQTASPYSYNEKYAK